MNYDLELDKVTDLITKERAKNVCIQLPDGLKPKSKEVADSIKSKTKANVFIWAGSCFGACDTPDLPKDFGSLKNLLF